MHSLLQIGMLAILCQGGKSAVGRNFYYTTVTIVYKSSLQCCSAQSTMVAQVS